MDVKNASLPLVAFGSSMPVVAIVVVAVFIPSAISNSYLWRCLRVVIFFPLRRHCTNSSKRVDYR